MEKKRNYRDPKIALETDIPLSEAAALETHPAVIAAINAVATERRDARTLWRAPTGTECDHIVMALEEYIYLGDFDATPDNIYQWGADEIRL
jgi:uncharacterized protein (DUF885 family)